MNRFRLNKATIENIRTNVGLDVSTISDSDISTIDAHIEQRKKKRLSPALEVGGVSPRGSVFLMFNRVFTSKEIDSRLSRIK
jgi:hypothetical protein